MNNINNYVYTDLVNNSDKITAYKNSDTFKFDPESSEDQQVLKTIVVEEIELVRYSKGGSFGFEDQFSKMAIQNILVPNKIVIAFIADFKLKPLSKLRSYKGILSKELKQVSRYLEQEVVIEGQSIIGGLLIVSTENVSIIIDKYFGDSSICCFIQSDNAIIFQELFLKNLLEKHMIHKQTSMINYFSLCKFLKEEERIIRIGGDGYDTVSIQIFSKK